MKADVLSGFKTIKVCTSYMYKEQNIEHLPYDIQEKNVNPVYKEFEGWDEDLTQKESFKKLPKTLKEYMSFIETELKRNEALLEALREIDSREMFEKDDEVGSIFYQIKETIERFKQI